jgi:hypothetical protein
LLALYNVGKLRVQEDIGMKMTKTVRVLILCFVVGMLVVVAPQVSKADNIAVGALVTFADGPGSGPGGEFILSSAGVAPFSTFCLEYNEYLSFGVPYTVDSISGVAYNGGISGQVLSGGDPLSAETAYLYHQFRYGTLSSYDYGTGAAHAASANQLQNAIWALEGEINPSTISDQALTWYNMAGAAVSAKSWTGLGDVQVLNISRNGTLAQSQLVLVPEPGILVLLGIALMGVAVFTRRFGHRV